MFEYVAFRFHRLVRRGQRGWRKLQNYVETNIWGRWHQMQLARRFIMVWLVLLALAGGSLIWQIHRFGQSAFVLEPIAGGTFVEGEVGNATTLNPVLPQSPVTDDMNSLIFDGLTKWGPDRKLEPDLATSWEVSADARTYTFHLRHNVKWQDGVAFNSSDVVFTLRAIQDPDSRSPLAASWQDVKVSAPDNYTIVYTLPIPYPPFLQSTTVGIVPRHLLENVDPSQLRTATFDQHPIGTGPFKVASFDTSAGILMLQANRSYFGGKPKLAGFEFRTYASSNQALVAYAQRQVDAISQITPDITTKAAQQSNLIFDQFALPSETTLFFNVTDSVLTDHAVRLALAQDTDRAGLIAASEPDLAIPANQPILPGQPGFTTSYRQDTYNPKAAAAGLTAAGWVVGKGGVRYKNGHALQLTVVTLSGSPLQAMAQALAKQWQPLGVRLTVKATDLNDLEQTYIRPRNFQMLLYGITIGADPDVYAYWHSSQVSDPGLNLSQYQSTAADKALEAGRLKSDPALRAAKYNEFLQTWDADQPAVVLATPVYLYGVTAATDGPQSGPITAPPDRFADVTSWTILRRAVRR